MPHIIIMVVIVIVVIVLIVVIVIVMIGVNPCPISKNLAKFHAINQSKFITFSNP